MATKNDLLSWTTDALRALGGEAHHIAVAKHVWENHEADLKASGNLLYTWQYDLRWAAHRLRVAGVCKPDSETRTGVWALQ